MQEKRRGHILVTLCVREDEESDAYISECLELRVSSCGRTIDEAFTMVQDALHVYLATIEEDGERERIFAEHGLNIIWEEEPKGRIDRIEAPLNAIISRRSVDVPARMAVAV